MKINFISIIYIKDSGSDGQFDGNNSDNLPSGATKDSFTLEGTSLSLSIIDHILCIVIIALIVILILKQRRKSSSLFKEEIEIEKLIY